uniref:Uncharacterized protein n=1 Tax=Oryza punctata TaxID=4537 RepID=A0A0E0KVP0_ORYPU
METEAAIATLPAKMEALRESPSSSSRAHGWRAPPPCTAGWLASSPPNSRGERGEGGEMAGRERR